MRDTIHITKKDAIAAMEAAIKERGEDFTYASMFDEGIGCQYTAPTLTDVEAYGWDEAPMTPACLVGLAFHLVWPELDRMLADHNDDNVYGVFGLDGSTDEQVEFDWGGAHGVIDPDAIEVLMEAQQKQDKGHSWGTALLKAKGVVS